MEKIKNLFPEIPKRDNEYFWNDCQPTVVDGPLGQNLFAHRFFGIGSSNTSWYTHPHRPEFFSGTLPKIFWDLQIQWQNASFNRESKKYRFFEFARVGGYPIIFFMLHIYQAKYGGHFWRGAGIEIPTPYPAQLLQTPKITQNSCFPGAP